MQRSYIFLKFISYRSAKFATSPIYLQSVSIEKSVESSLQTAGKSQMRSFFKKKIVRRSLKLRPHIAKLYVLEKTCGKSSPDDR